MRVQEMIEQLESGDVSQALIKKRLEAAVNIQNSLEEEEHAAKSKNAESIPLFLTPLFDMSKADDDIEHPLFTFRPIHPISP